MWGYIKLLGIKWNEKMKNEERLYGKFSCVREKKHTYSSYPTHTVVEGAVDSRGRQGANCSGCGVRKLCGGQRINQSRD